MVISLEGRLELLICLLNKKLQSSAQKQLILAMKNQESIASFIALC
jgi:hypothetical protein